MKLRDKLAKRLRSEGRRAENGAVLVIVASSLLVIMGMAAFSVDYGWIYYNQLNARKAAESAALAGVANMPLPNCDPPVSGTQPYDTAIDIAGRNGYSATNGDTVSPAMGSTCARLQVTVNRTIPTFFMKAFGINTLSVSETATAEHLPNLKMGSDESYLGEDPDGGAARNADFFLAVNGDRTNKAQGDAYTSECYGDYNTSCQGTNFEFNQGFADGNPSYYYAIDVPQTVTAGSSVLTVQIYDPQMNVGGVTDDRELNAPVNSGPYSNSRLRFRLLEPDDTPSSWIDNTAVVCTQTYYQEDHPSYNPSQMDSWVSFCADAAIQGVYVLEVRQTGNVDLLNAFSIRALINNSPTNDVAVYGLGAMSLWNSQAGAGKQFKLVKLDDVYAGSRLVVQLWDVGDINGTGSLEFKGALAPIDCQIRERTETGAITVDWGPDDGGTGCFENINPEREYNNEWVDFAFDVPADFTCTGDACWATVQYNLPGNPHDRTTWAAFIDGQPIHLIP